MAKPAKSKKLCQGCRDNYYNQPGNSHTGECWLYKDAKVIKRKAVHMDQRPPWTQKAQWYMSCYNEDRYIFVTPETTR